MSRRTNIIGGLIAMIGFAAACATPAFAVEPRSIDDVPTTTAGVPNIPEPHSTFAIEEADDTAKIRFGNNLIYAGNNLTADAAADGLSLVFGNNLQLKTRSDYAFVAGNVINFTAETERDVFIAGNIINLEQGARIGRDIFVAGNNVSVKTDLPRDFSAAASFVSFENVTVSGNVNVDSATLQFSGKVEIKGKLTCSDKTVITGIENVTYAELEIYESISSEPTLGEMLLARTMSICGIFVALVIIALTFPHFKQLLERESTSTRLGMNLLRGAGLLIAIPLLILVILISFFAASAGVALLGAYALIIYAAQAFSGAWVGYALIEKLCHLKLPVILEGAIGVIILGCLAMIPGLGFIVTLFSSLLGVGLIASWVRPAKNLPEAVATKKDFENPFRGQKKAVASPKKGTSKATTRKTATKKSASKKK